VTINEVYLKSLIDEVFNLAKPFAIESEIKVEIEEFENLAIKADFFRIKQVLFNLLSNAIK
jgi:signal transduction histidine kinase